MRLHEFKHFSNSIWAYDDTLNFKLDSISKGTLCEVSLELRVGRGYPYRHLWVEIEQLLSDSTISKGNICLNIYDSDGRFLADGFGDLYQIGAIVLPKLELPDSTAYTFKVRHIMSDLYLPDIKDVGIRVESIENR
ncbi:MAG: gliding motility lipoprotein GldH [Bacteroidales bacterium]